MGAGAGASWREHRGHADSYALRRAQGVGSLHHNGTVKPYSVRMFAEVGCDFALWGDPWQPLPVNGGRTPKTWSTSSRSRSRCGRGSSPGLSSTTGTTA